MDIAETEREIIHFRQHSRLIRNVNVAVVVVDEDIPARPSGGLKVHESCSIWCEYLRQQNLRVDLDQVIALAIDVQNLIKTGFIEVQERVHFVSGSPA